MTDATAALIARRVRKGYNAAESEALLRDLIRSHSGDNLEAALVYQDFATERGAARFVASLQN